MKGLFISFEGTDGCGKSTQMDLFTSYLESKGYDLVHTREPGGTVISEEIRDIILNPKYKGENPRTEALLFAASRAQHVSELIRPSLESGKTVLSDRYVDSSYVYQGLARGLGDWVKTINDFAIDGLLPDLTFFLMLTPEESVKRIEAGREGKDRLEQEDISFHQMVYEGYISIAKNAPERIVVIDASQSIENVALDIRTSFERFIAARTEKE